MSEVSDDRLAGWKALRDVLRREARQDWRGNRPGHLDLCARAADALDEAAAEVERLRAWGPEGQTIVEAREAALNAEVERLRAGQEHDHYRCAWMTRYEAAEARLDAVRALCDYRDSVWPEALGTPASVGTDEVRAALGDIPGEAQ